MLRVVMAGLVVSFIASATTLRAQVAMRADSVALSPAAPDTAPRLVRVSSDRLPFQLTTLLGAKCGDPTGLTNLKRFFGGSTCKPQMTGAMSRMDADSLIFVRNGRSIALSMRDVQRVEVRSGRSAWRSAVGGVFGGLAGAFGSLMIGIGGGYGDNDGAFVATAAALTAGGAAIGAYRGGKAWTALPRPEGAPRGPR